MKTLFNSLKALIKRRKRTSVVIAAVVGSLAVIATAGAFTASISKSTPPLLAQTGREEMEEKSSTGFTLVQPTLVSGSSSIIILGKVLSNETANIYPRRDGVVEDVLVDIGDTVTKGQVVAVLLSKGVEGQSAAMIAEKGARKAQAESDVMSAQSVAHEAVNKAQQQIVEMQTALKTAKSEQESILRMFSQQKSNVTQTLEQAFIAVRSARQLIEHIATGTNTRPGDEIREDDIDDQLGLLNFQTRFVLALAFETLNKSEDGYLAANEERRGELIPQLVQLANDMLLKTSDMLSATPSVTNPQPGHLTHQELSNMNMSVLNAQTSILKAKENFEDAQNAFLTLTTKEPALYSAWKSGSKNPNVQSNKVQMISAQLSTTKENLNFVDSQQQQMIEKTKSMVNVADAMLNAEYALSGNRQILSPFSGVVSKRFIEVGGMVMPSMPAFELVDVPTSLSKIAKSEIQFGLPEHLFSAISVGDKITFLLPNDDVNEYEAEVTRKSPQIDMQTHTITVQAKIDDSLMIPNHANVRVRLIDQKLPTFSVPSFAVKREEEGNIIWVLDDKTNKPQKVSVTVRSEDGEFAEISGDITEVTQIILDPPDFITQRLND
ncbi:HlyD family efflux transporter periplasmic adaptor subunit [Patescibacteria group bacterium]|nr:HlyD family efflux transporter periplasmic adaptor subunit [Patescibacteria group bacterium]